MEDWLVKLSGKGTVVLTKRGKWQAADPSAESTELAGKLQTMFDQYMKTRYKPAEGFPGYQWAKRLADHNGLTYEDRPCPPIPKGVIS